MEQFTRREICTSLFAGALCTFAGGYIGFKRPVNVDRDAKVMENADTLIEDFSEKDLQARIMKNRWKKSTLPSRYGHPSAEPATDEETKVALFQTALEIENKANKMTPKQSTLEIQEKTGNTFKGVGIGAVTYVAAQIIDLAR